MNMGVYFYFIFLFSTVGESRSRSHRIMRAAEERGILLFKIAKTTEIFYIMVKLRGERRTWGLDYGLTQSKIAQIVYRVAL